MEHLHIHINYVILPLAILSAFSSLIILSPMRLVTRAKGAFLILLATSIQIPPSPCIYFKPVSLIEPQLSIQSIECPFDVKKSFKEARMIL